MHQTIRIMAALAVLGALVAAGSACGGQDRSGPEGGGPTATAPAATPAGDPDAGTYHFPEIKALVERSGQATFTAEYDATTPMAPDATQVTLVRQAPVTAVQMAQARLLWTPDDSYLCQDPGTGPQCFRRGAPSENEDPQTGPERDWAAVLADAGLDSLSPVGTWQYLEGLYGDGTELVESAETIAGQPSSCIELTNEAVLNEEEDLAWSGTVVACFLDTGVIARYRIELSDNQGSSQVTVELTGYSTTADPALVEVPTDAPVQG